MPHFTGTDLVCFRGERTVFDGLGFDLTPGGALVLRGAEASVSGIIFSDIGVADGNGKKRMLL